MKSLKRAGTTMLSGRAGFTLVELLVVVAVIAILSGLLIPVLIQARERAMKAASQQTAAKQQILQDENESTAIPTGSAPIINALDLNITLMSSYHRIGMDVFTRYRADCTGHIVFRHPGGTDDSRVLLVIPFPDSTLEARDVQLALRRPGNTDPVPPNDLVFNKRGIYCLCSPDRGQPLTADVRFTALGREQLDYALPPARQLQSVAITVNLPGAETRIVPDDSLQPTAADPHQLRWEFKNLVSDRRISVQIPGAQAPLARMLLLSRLVALAVLLFGAGFLYLSEQAKPGQLDGFRLGHFLLLALTYSLFFVIFAVLEFHGRLGTLAAMAVSAVFSLPLLVLHVSRFLDLGFAITRVVPLTIFTLALVVNGVYGAELRDYVFIAAAIFTIAFLTLTYPAWAAGRERHRLVQEAAYTVRRRALTEKITTEIGAQISELSAADVQAGELLKSPLQEEASGARARLERAREPVASLVKEHEETAKRLSYLPDRPGWEAAAACNDLERKMDAFQERLQAHLAHLLAGLAAFRSSLQSSLLSDREGAFHCVACGRLVPNAPFCQACGAPHPAEIVCTGCGERVLLPIHLLSGYTQNRELYCPRCGTPLMALRAGSVEGAPSSEQRSGQ